MQTRYNGVVVRLLASSERRVEVNETQTPLVISPGQSSSPKVLCDFLRSHSAQISEDLVKHGAILLRGFRIESCADFERSVLSIGGMNGISEMMLSEPGRTRVTGMQYVMHTNTLVKR